MFQVISRHALIDFSSMSGENRQSSVSEPPYASLLAKLGPLP